MNLKDADSRTTLYILALENKMKIVKYLLEHSNINVNIPDSEGRTALHVAAWQGHLEMVKVLITQGKENEFCQTNSKLFNRGRLRCQDGQTVAYTSI